MKHRSCGLFACSLPVVFLVSALCSFYLEPFYGVWGLEGLACLVMYILLFRMDAVCEYLCEHFYASMVFYMTFMFLLGGFLSGFGKYVVLNWIVR